MAEVARLLRTPVSGSLLILTGALLGLYLFATQILVPPFDMAGDAPTYLEAMKVLNGEEVPDTFTPNRILATFGSVATVAAFSWFTGDYLTTWFFINTLYFFGLGFVTYVLFRKITESDIAGILGALFVVGNYDVLTFGLNYLMDLSGWFWFMFALLNTYLYMEGEERRHLWYAALAAGVGTLFKEYAFFAFAPLGLFLIYRYWRTPVDFTKHLVPLIVSLLPLVLVHVAVYLAYGYSYLDWYGMNATVFAWGDWAWNASRSFLVVLSFLLPLMVLGALAFMARMRERPDPKVLLFTLSLVLPALAVFLWPIITERLVFLAVPLVALLAAFGFARHERHWPWFGLVWILYVLLALKTDGYILSYLYTL